MKEAINILRKAGWVGSTRYGQTPQSIDDAENWVGHLDPATGFGTTGAGRRDEYKLLNQPEHKAQGWVHELEKHPVSGRYRAIISHYKTDWKKLGDKVKAVELKDPSGRYHHVIHRNEDGANPDTWDQGVRREHEEVGRTLPDAHWKTTHVDTHTGKVVGQSWHSSVEDAVYRRHDFQAHPDYGNWRTLHDFPKAHITKIHYHDPK